MPQTAMHFKQVASLASMPSARCWQGWLEALPTSNLPDAATFTGVMLEDVMALEPGFVELECACRKLRHSQKFMPSISEIVAAVKDEKKARDKRWNALDCIEDSYNAATTLRDGELKRREEEAVKAKVAEEARIAKVKANAEHMAAKSQPIAVGDRVHNGGRAGAGTVTEIEPDAASRSGVIACAST